MYWTVPDMAGRLPLTGKSDFPTQGRPVTSFRGHRFPPKGAYSQKRAMQTKVDRDKTKGTHSVEQVAFSVVSDCGYGHEKDIKGQSLQPKSYPIKKQVKRGMNLSETVRQPSDIVLVA
jgi:hypothetical protein